MRTETARAFIAEVRPDIVRGNASEILALRRDEASAKGVDSRLLSKTPAAERPRNTASSSASAGPSTSSSIGIRLSGSPTAMRSCRG
jgi:hydroxyethylthiazole kinase-like sugar kinase family protein